MISIIKKKISKSLYVQFFLDGKCVQRSTKLGDTPKNREFIKNKIIPSLELKIARGEINTKKQDKSFKFFADKYLKSKDSLKSFSQVYTMVENQIMPYFKGRDIDTIKRYEIKELAETKLEKATPKRVRMILNVIASIIDIAIDYEIIANNVARNIALPKHTKKEFEPFSQDEVNMILENSEGWFQTF